MLVRTMILTLTVAALALAGCGSQAAAPAPGGATGANPPAGATFKVGVVKQTTHPALDAAEQGIKDGFAASGLAVEIDSQNANNDAATLTSIIDGFRDKKVNLVVAIGSQPLQAAFNGLKDSGVPVVFNTVTDPYAAGAAKDKDNHPGVTGIQALPPVRQAFDLITEIKPGAAKVGIVWTSSEKNSEVVTGIAREYAKTKGIEFVERTVTKADEVLAAAEALAGEKVDAIFISTDSTVVSALEAVVKVANDNGILLVCNDPASSKRGCAAALGLDYYDNGKISVTELAVPILKGEATADTLPIKVQEKQNIAVNTAAAKLQGVALPQALLDRADKDKVYDAITPKQ